MISWSDVLTVISVAAAVIFGYAAFSRNKQLDLKADSNSSGQMASDLGYIKSSTDEIKTELQRHREDMTNMRVDIARIDASTKQAHKRIDKIETGPIIHREEADPE